MPLPDDPSNVIDVWQWVAVALSVAVVAQWGYMISSQHSARKERQDFYSQVTAAIADNTRVIRDLLVWLKSGGK